MLPEEKARVLIDKQLEKAGWDIVSRNEYVPGKPQAVKEALMKGGLESDYLLFIDGKAVAVVEAKKSENNLGKDVKAQVENYAHNPKNWYGLWYDNLIPLVYITNGRKTYGRNLLQENSDYKEIKEIPSPKKNLELINRVSEYGVLPLLKETGLRQCQFDAENNFEDSFINGKKKNLAVMATGSGKTYLACLASYRLLTYCYPVKRILFLADRNNLAKQAVGEFKKFDRTENHEKMDDLYTINRLRKENDLNADIVVSTIQKLYAALTGKKISTDNDDLEDERNTRIEDEDDQEAISLGSNLKLPPDYFQFIIIDECHRSIYGKWKAVLKYFSNAIVLGLTATPTPEAYAFFDENVIEKYTYDDSVIDGVNVPFRVFRIKTNVTENGGTIQKGSKVIETVKWSNDSDTHTAKNSVEYKASDLDRSVVNCDQIRKVLTAYRDSIYTNLYPDREKDWKYIPKTLIFAKSDHHASVIVDIAKEVFGSEFENGQIPSDYVKKITYSSGNSDDLIREFRTEKEFRIAVTVTLVATGTDIKPLEVVLFMKDVQSTVLYTQMKGRGCRVISEEKLREVTPNANGKSCFYIVDAVGVTEHEKKVPVPVITVEPHDKVLDLEHLLEHLAHNEVSDANLWLLRDYCSMINSRYENSKLFGYHLDKYIDNYGFSPKTIAVNIQYANDSGLLKKYRYIDPSHQNNERMNLIKDLISNINARKDLLELQRGYFLSTDEDPDTIEYSGFSKETAADLISNFEKYIKDNADSIEALRIIYNSEGTIITYAMLIDLKDKLLSENRQFSIYQLWNDYKTLDEDGNVETLDVKKNLNALTNLIQIVRYAYGKNQKLTSLINGYAQQFNLYVGQNQRALTADQVDVMKQIADYIVRDGAISVKELNEVDTDLWRKGINCFGASRLATEMQAVSKFVLRA